MQICLNIFFGVLIYVYLSSIRSLAENSASKSSGFCSEFSGQDEGSQEKFTLAARRNCSQSVYVTRSFRSLPKDSFPCSWWQLHIGRHRAPSLTNEAVLISCQPQSVLLLSMPGLMEWWHLPFRVKELVETMLVKLQYSYMHLVNAQ